MLLRSPILTLCFLTDGEMEADFPKILVVHGKVQGPRSL